jgi:class 3 adenylate cyclase
LIERPEQDAGAAAPELYAQSEMRLSTVMMVDMVASTEMSDRLGPEASFNLLHDVLTTARAVVAAHGGVMVTELGDGFFALFGAPVSIERASLAACRAGLDVCASIRAEADRLRARYGVAPQLRVGLAAGEVLVTGQAGDGTLKVTGNAVNLATRLEALAEPNGVVCSDSVAVEVEGWVRFDPLGKHSLKGFAAPVRTFRILEMVADHSGRRDGGARGAESFVGRTEELARLMGWYTHGTDARPVCLVVGEAGIGKSRLLQEFATRLGNRRLIVGSCYPTRTARPLAPLIELLRSFAGWRPNLPEDALHAALDPVMTADQAHRDALIKLIADKGPADAWVGEADAVSLRRALASALIELGQREDCLVALEDLHWIDPLSGEVLLEVVGDALDRFRMLGTTRPADWLRRLPQARIERVETGPMQAPDIGAIAQALTGTEANAALVDRVARSSEGNPFFAIEILHNISVHGDGVDAGRIGAVQNIALARFDRLDAETRTLLRMASIQGRNFRLDVLRQATGTRESDVAGLVEAAEGIVEPDPADPAGAGRFSHILFRDSIHATIPSSACKAMNLATAEALEACEPAGAHGLADRLADHYELGGAPMRAVRFLREAAHGAYGMYALETCKTLTERAFRLIEADLDRFERAVLEDAVSIRMRCLDVMDQFRSVIEVSEVWLPRLRTAAGSPAQALLIALTSKAQLHMGDVEQGLSMVTEALEMATRHGHERTIAYAKVVRMRALTDSGKGTLGEVERLFEETRTFTEDLHDGTLYANRMFHMMAAYRTAGLLRQANEVNDEIESVGARHNHPHVTLVADWNRALNAAQANDFHTALSRAGPGLKNAARNTALREVFMNITLFARMGLGKDVSLTDIERIRESSDRRGELTSRNAAAMSFAFACFFKGRVRQGLRALRDCETLMDAAGTVEGRRFFLLYRAELFLIIRGDVEADGPKPKLRGLDIAFAIYLRLIARRSAKRLLNRLLSQFDRPEGLFVARAQAGLAAIAAAEGRTDAAREGLELAETLFRAEGLTAELDRLATYRAKAGV